MSDVMPYTSSRWCELTAGDLTLYRREWGRHLRRVISSFRPDVVHTHHVWLVSSLIKGIAPEVPVVCHCHATGLRQMQLCPQLADEVRAGCRDIDTFAALHEGDAAAIVQRLGVPASRVHIVGAGFREDVFTPKRRTADVSPAAVYIGKLAAAKGLPSLLDAWSSIARSRPDAVLHVAGGGSGHEADDLRDRMCGMTPSVRYHGRLDQRDVAELMRRSRICVLPSFFEGLPLVLVEALACGCRLVATDLPGVQSTIAPAVGKALKIVEMPPLVNVDTPDVAALPAFAERLTAALDRALDAPPLDVRTVNLEPFTWRAVFRRVEAIWRELIGQ